MPVIAGSTTASTAAAAIAASTALPPAFKVSLAVSEASGWDSGNAASTNPFGGRREDNALVAYCRIVLPCRSIAARRVTKDRTMSNAYIYDGLRTPFARHAG